MQLTGAQHDELMEDVREFQGLSDAHDSWARRMELHRKWVVSEKVTPEEWLEMVQTNG